MTLKRSIRLGYTDETSDKVYQIDLVEMDGGYKVEGQYGRRGRALKTQDKTNGPVGFAEADQKFEAVLKEKLRKGYQIEGQQNGGVQRHTPMAPPRPVSFRPQLLTPVDEDTLLAKIDAQPYRFALQIKHDGERRGVKIEQDGIYALARKGHAVTLNDRVAEAIIHVKSEIGTGDLFLDCEDMGDRLIVFDVLMIDGEEMRDAPLETRLKALHGLNAHIKAVGAGDAIAVSTATRLVSKEAAEKAIHAAREANEEGVVIKDLNARYRPGRGSLADGHAMKLKFVEDIEAWVDAIVPGKRSIAISLRKSTDGLKWVEAGHCGVPVNHPMPTQGDVVTVQYLYAYAGGRLAQPVYKGVRPGFTESDVGTLDDLKFMKVADSANVSHRRAEPLDWPVF